MDPSCAPRRPRRNPARVAAPLVLDAATAPALAARVGAAAGTHARVTVDLRHVAVVDAAGLRTLRRLADRLPVVLHGASPTTRRRLGLTRLGASRRALRA